MMLRQTALCFSLLAVPAAAQDADPHNQLVEGYMACLSGGGQVDLTQAMLVDALSWTRDDGGEEGLIYFNPGAGEATQVYMAEDGSFCHVEGFTTGSAIATEILKATLDAEGGAKFTPAKDDMGCERLDLETKVTATITSGGNDPICVSETDSGVRFAFE